MLRDLVISVVIGLVVAWVLLAALVLLERPRGLKATELVRLLPDSLRLVRRLAADRSLSRGIRVRLWLALAYLASPIDVIPDFIPVIGYVDDVAVLIWALRSAVRRAGPEAVAHHWPGTEPGLAALWRAARLPGDPTLSGS